MELGLFPVSHKLLLGLCSTSSHVLAGLMSTSLLLGIPGTVLPLASALAVLAVSLPRVNEWFILKPFRV